MLMKRTRYWLLVALLAMGCFSASYMVLWGSGFTNLTLEESMSVTSLDLGDGDITNVGDISLDSISSDAGADIGITSGISVNGSVEVSTINGIDYTPGSDTDADLITVTVTGTPKLWWDEATDSFEFNKSVTIPGGSLRIGTLTITEDDGDLDIPNISLSGRMRLKHSNSPNVAKKAGHSMLWVDSDDKLYFEKADGTDIEITDAGGSLWQRIGTELSPLTAGDDIVTTGEIEKSGVIVPNRNEIYNYTTGWLTGGAMSVNSGDNTKIDITAGTAIITDYTDQANPIFTTLTWTAQTALDPAMATRSLWVGVQDDGGGGTQFVYDTEFDAIERRTIVTLGRIWDSAGSGPQITNVGDYERPAWGLLTAFQDFILEYGSWNIEGNVYSANGANLLLDKSSGKSFRYHAEDTIGKENVHPDAAQVARTPYAYHLQGVSTITSETDIDSDYYDNNGVKTAVTSNDWTIQEVWYFPVSQTCHVLYGQVVYNSKVDAIAGVTSESKVRNTGILDGAILRAYLILQEGCTDLTDSAFAEIREAGGGIGSGGGGSIYWNRVDSKLSPSVGGDDILLNTGETLSIADMTTGSVPFFGASGLLSQDNSKLFWNNTNDRLGIGTDSPNAPLEVRGVYPGSVGGFPSGMLHVTRPSDVEFSNAVITGHNLFNGNTQLWYLGNSSFSNNNLCLINRQDAGIGFHTNSIERWTITPDGDVGIGTTTVPHGGIGLAMLAINSSSSGSEGSHVQYTNSTDDYPLFTQVNWAHDDVSLAFDSYYDLGWKSSDIGSNFALRKNGDKFSIEFDSGIAQGSGVIWNTGFELDVAGDITTLSNLDVGGSIRSGSSGSAAIPSFSWTDDTDAGFYRISENVFAVTAGNAEILRFSNAEIYASKRLKLTSGALLFSGADLEFGSGNSTAVKMTLKSDGKFDVPGVYAETDASAANVMVAADGSLRRSTSSRKIKENIDYRGVSPEFTLQFKPVSFDAKADGKHHLGLISEDVYALDQRFATDGGPKDLKGLDINAILSAAIATIQEQDKRIRGLEQRIFVLENQI